jgi:hypothetical protein
MDQLLPLGRGIAQVVQPTYHVYAPLLLERAEKIRSTKRETFSYGESSRQTLDVYTPMPGTESVTGNGNSVLVFLYGGGFARGDKINTGYLNGLVYANLGHYFAENLGFKVVILDYRLICHGAKFPSGGEDVQLAIGWILAHLGGTSQQPLELYIMGNSAGGVHLSTYLFCRDFAASRSSILSATGGSSILKGVIFLAVPFHFENADPEREKVLRAYFGADIVQTCPLGLLKITKNDDTIHELQRVPMLVLTGTLDPETEILIPTADFVEECQRVRSFSEALVVERMQGHNHVSPVLGLGTGRFDEEAWGRRVVNFIANSAGK